MALQLDSSAQDDQSLASLWRANAQRATGRTITTCLGLGLLAAVLPLALGRATFIAAAGLVVAAFGAYAAVVQPSVGGRVLDARTQGTIGIALSVIAAVAGVSGALLVLGMIFGGSLEVMRR